MKETNTNKANNTGRQTSYIKHTNFHNKAIQLK